MPSLQFTLVGTRSIVSETDSQTNLISNYFSLKLPEYASASDGLRSMMF